LAMRWSSQHQQRGEGTQQQSAAEAAGGEAFHDDVSQLLR
jgi:hypothetical protein